MTRSIRRVCQTPERHQLVVKACLLPVANLFAMLVALENGQTLRRENDSLRPDIHWGYKHGETPTECKLRGGIYSQRAIDTRKTKKGVKIKCYGIQPRIAPLGSKSATTVQPGRLYNILRAVLCPGLWSHYTEKTAPANVTAGPSDQSSLPALICNVTASAGPSQVAAAGQFRTLAGLDVVLFLRKGAGAACQVYWLVIGICS